MLANRVRFHAGVDAGYRYWLMVNDAYPRDAESIEYSYVGGSKVNMNLCTGNSYVGGSQNALVEGSTGVACIAVVSGIDTG